MEAELRRTVQTLFEQEEEILNLHMSNIQENADLLTQEGKMLQIVQKENVTEAEMEEYVAELEKILDRKEDLILAHQMKLEEFQNELSKEEKLSKNVGSLTQY